MISDFERGEWAGYNRILALTQTYDTRMIRKADLYQEIMELRPLGDRPLEEDEDWNTLAETEQRNPVMTEATENPETPQDTPTVPDGWYALAFSPAGEIRVVVPVLEDDEPMTNGHILMIGLSMKMNEPDWATNIIAETEQKLIQMRAAAMAAEEAAGDPPTDPS